MMSIRRKGGELRKVKEKEGKEEIPKKAQRRSTGGDTEARLMSSVE